MNVRRNEKRRQGHAIATAIVAVLSIITLSACGGGGGGGRGSGGGGQQSPPPPPPPPPANRAPTVTIATPATGNSFIEGTQVRFEGSAQDPEDGAISGSNLVWTTSAGANLGTGGALTVTTLELGTHTIQLAATDSAGLRSVASVSIRITEPPLPAAARAGETNPYAGRMQRTPVKRDDELVLFGRASGADQLVYGIVDEPVSRYNSVQNPVAPPAPRITARSAGLTVIAGAAGRIQSTTPHQAALITRNSAGTQFRLEVIELLDPGQSAVATLALAPPFPTGPFAVGVADLDAFEELSGVEATTPPEGRNYRYHDEVALAYAEMSGDELRARVRVLSFEDVMFPAFREGPPPGPTTDVSAFTTVAMHPASRLVVAHGDALFNASSEPRLLIAYVDTTRRISIDVFAYRRMRAADSNGDPRTDNRSLELVFRHTMPRQLTEAATLAGGWDIVVGRGAQFGMENPLQTFDVVFDVRQEDGDMRQDGWRLMTSDGAPGAWNFGSDLFEFGRFTNAANQEIALTILPDSPVRVALGRVVQPGSSSCEALGLLVLAHTDRGPAVQTLSAFMDDIDAGDSDFGPMHQSPVWPAFSVLRNRAQTTQISNAAMAAGGLVSSRNGLIDHRGVGITGELFARRCNGAEPRPLLGQMPSFYVVEPELSQLSAVTIALLGNVLIDTGPLDASIDSMPLMLAADSNGDAAYYESARCYRSSPTSTTEKCRRLFLGDADLHYTIENMETQNVVLQQPPKHVDFLRGLGGMVDVSMRDDYYAEFAQTTSNDGSIDRKLKTDWMLGERVAFGWGAGASIPGGGGEGGGSGGGGGGDAGGEGSGKSEAGAAKAEQELSIEIEHRSAEANFVKSQVNVSLTQTTGAVDDDVVWSKVQSTDFWRFPVSGGRRDGDPDSPTALAKSAYMEIALPGEPVISIGPGSASDGYQPTHQIGNILSYPAIAGSTQDIGELFEFLGRYVPREPDGSRRCMPLQDGDINGCIAEVNDFLQQQALIMAGEEFMAGQFVTVSDPVDVAEELQVGGISYSSELEFDEQVQRGATITNNDSIKAGLKTKIEVSGKVKEVVDVEGSVEAELKAEASFENETVSENTLGTKTKIALHVPSSIPIQRSYRVRPSFGFTPGGSLQVSYQVSTEGAASTFWRQHYSTPDAALNLPLRIVRAGEGFELNTDFSRNRMKGFFVRDGAGIDPTRPWEKVGALLSAAPLAGDPVQLEVQVMNLSVASPLGPLTVEFTAQAYENGAPVGPVLPIGQASIDFLPYRGQFADAPNGHITSTYVIWDTTSFGPSSSNGLKDYLVYVTLDSGNALANETHELNDRYNDPLRGPLNEVVDAQLEKGQNNRGWALVRIAPSLEALQASGPKNKHRFIPKTKAPEPAVRLSVLGANRWGLSESFQKAGAVPRLKVKARETLRAKIRLHSETLAREHGILQVFDGDPALGAQMILSKAVQGIAGDDMTHEEIEWRPQHTGDRVLYVRYFGKGGVMTEALQVPVTVEP